MATEYATTPLDSGEIAVIMYPEPERSIEPINDDLIQPSYKSEQLLSGASNVSLPSRRRHWMNTQLRNKLRAGESLGGNISNSITQHWLHFSLKITSKYFFHTCFFWARKEKNAENNF